METEGRMVQLTTKQTDFILSQYNIGVTLPSQALQSLPTKSKEKFLSILAELFLVKYI